MQLKKFMKKIVIVFHFLMGFLVLGQPKSSSSVLFQAALQDNRDLFTNSRVKNIFFENIGPVVMSGRVVALAVNPKNSIEFYVAYASGGVWHTVNNGTSFVCITDNAPTQNIGELAVDWSTNTIWVGTGENNSSRSSYSGIGILKTTDNGLTWEKKGLNDSHHIGRILINPDDPDHLVVGVTGHLYSRNKERGVYITTDGGDSWRSTLFVNDSTGIIDMVYVPDNFSIQYAAAWEKDRKAWHFKGSGSSSGIYKSIDAGATWQKITVVGSNFPQGEGVGRIGLAVFDENIIYAIHDSQFRREKEDKKEDKYTKEYFKRIGKADFLKLEDKKLGEFLEESGFPKRYSVKKIKEKISKDEITPMDVALYLEDSNSLLFDTPVVGAEVYRSDDGGKTWIKTHKDYLDDLYYSYGYYFGHIHVDSNNADRIYIYGVPLLTSEDSGKTFTSIGKPNVHADHHALWIDSELDGHLIDGNDGGVNITYDNGKNWIKNNVVSVGQFYAINVDYEKPYNVYGGLQDNGVWKGAHNAKINERWYSTGHNPWKSIMGGDGMQIQIDKRNSNIIYTGYQFGNYYRLDLEKNKNTYIQPRPNLGDRPYRFNWQTPILLSVHNQDILYLGSNYLHRSLDRGNDWEVISDDLTTGGKKGNVSYGTLTTIAESPFQFGLLYVGSDDGYVHLSKNGGGSWERISDNFPSDLWVSRVVASQHKKERVYVTLNGYRWDDFTPYVYKSEDYGKTWEAIHSNLPASPVNVIKEDTKNKNILYLGNDHGVYISFDKGQKWEPFVDGLTNAAVHDLVIQTQAKHLLVGTHGRSIYKADISLFEKVDDNFFKTPLHLFEIDTIKHNKNWGKVYNKWREDFLPKEINIAVFSREKDKYNLAIKDKKGVVLYTTSGNFDAGFNFIPYNLTISSSRVKNYNKKNKKSLLKAAENKMFFLPKGIYTITLKTMVGDKTKKIVIK